MITPLRRLFMLLALPALAALLTGCAADGEGPTTQGVSELISKGIGVDRLAGRWDVQSLTGVDFGPLPPDMELPWLEITESGAVSGSTGVNRFSTSLDAAALLDGRFDVAPAATTRRAGPPAAMNLEQAFLDVLNQAESFGLNDNVLSLLDQRGALLAEFTAGG